MNYIIKYSYTILFVLIAIGTALSIISALNLCSAACGDVHHWKLFGFAFEVIGIPLFITLLFLHAFSKNNPLLGILRDLILFASIGAEVLFIGLQKFVIGKWCPVCLSIAAIIFCAAFLTFYIRFFTRQEGDKKMRSKLLFFSFLAVLFGFFSAFTGVSKEDKVGQLEQGMEDRLLFGNKESDIRVYLFTDWRCPACRKIEIPFEEMFPDLTKKAGVVFVDVDVHPETLNFSPYNLSFAIFDKPYYFKLRHMLTAISLTTGEPSEEEVESAAHKLGAPHKQLNYIDVTAGLKYFQETADKYKIDTTPSLVIVNTRTGKSATLTGTADINRNKVFETIDTLSK